MKSECRHIAFLVVPNATLLDVTGPYEVFAQAIECMKNRGGKAVTPYVLHTLSTTDDLAVKTASGLRIMCDQRMDQFDIKADTLFVSGVSNSLKDKVNEHVLDWIRQQSTKVRRLCSVCTGTFFLADAGVLAGKRATTHWEVCSRLAREHPEIKVEHDPIFIKDGHIYTSAGISSGMDLALALVEEDQGRELALEVAKQMVLYLKRPGNQSQYSSFLSHQDVDYRPIQEIENWIADHLERDMPVEKLAEQAGMSPRNFARVFVRETGTTPARYIDKLRIETACRYLVETQLSLKEIAESCGLKSIDHMRRTFVKYLELTPSEYRRNFKTAF